MMRKKKGMKIIHNEQCKFGKKFEVYYGNELVAKFRTMKAAKVYAENSHGEETLITEDTNNLEDL